VPHGFYESLSICIRRKCDSKSCNFATVQPRSVFRSAPEQSTLESRLKCPNIQFCSRFNLFYYANYEFAKTDTPKETLLTIDSRGGGKKEEDDEKDFDLTASAALPLIETAIQTK
jgi:hypothetical protein